MIDACRLATIAPSLGATETLIEQPAYMSYFELTPEERQAIGIHDDLVRLSLGLEDAEDLIEDLSQARSRRKLPLHGRRGSAARLRPRALVRPALRARPPIAKFLLPTAPPLSLAALLYLGAGAAFFLAPRRRAEAPLTRADVPWLAGAVIAGAALGPVLMLWGLSRVSGLTASLLLNLRGAVHHRARGARVRRAPFPPRGAGRRAGGLRRRAARTARGVGEESAAGAGAIALACLCWALDNNIAARLALKDPVQVLRVKALCAGGANLLIAIALGQSLPPLPTVGGALALGAISYGASLLLYLRAQRSLGAARQAALFAAAPFAGAVASILLLGDRPALADLGAAALMAAGVWVCRPRSTRTRIRTSRSSTTTCTCTTRTTSTRTRARSASRMRIRTGIRR